MSGVEAMIVDAPAIRMGSRLVEALDAAMAAKQVIRLAAAKPVAGQRIRALQQREVILRYDQMNKPCPGANRAVAVEQFRRWSHLRPKADSAAVAAAMNRCHYGDSSSRQIYRVP